MNNFKLFSPTYVATLISCVVLSTICPDTMMAVSDSSDTFEISNQNIPMLDGQALTVTDLYHLKNNPELLIKNLENKLLTYNFSSEREKNDCKRTLERIQFLQKNIAPYLFWWQSHPMIGMRLEEPFWPLQYPYLPHAFALWELAPSLGKNSDVYLIDTGIAAFTLDLKNFYRKHQDLQMLVDFSRAKYNFTSHEQDILDPFEQLVEMLMKYTNDSEENEDYIRSHLPDWIRTYLKNGSTHGIAAYICRDGKSPLWKQQSSKRILTEEGKRALREILQGQLGFKPKHVVQKKRYTLVDLKNPNNQRDIIMEFLPTAPIFMQDVDTMNNNTKEDEFFAASYESGHGSHSSGIIGALLHSYEDTSQTVTKAHIREWLQRDSGICGLAPHGHTIMIKGLRSDGLVNNRSVIIKSVRQAQRLGAKILNLSLKLDDRLDRTEPDIVVLEKLLKKIPYVVACSGNASSDKKGVLKASTESYPAKFPSVPFDVGSFSWRCNPDGTFDCPIIETSQYQKNIGPKFVMPGQNILSCGLVPQQSENSMYVFMQGTSTSAPMISGFLSLVLAEFSDVFAQKYERSIILKVCYSSAFKLHNSDEWNTKCLLGALDMRTALFVLHVLAALEPVITKTKALKDTYPFYKNIDRYIAAIHTVLMHDVMLFVKQLKVEKFDFKKDYMGFFTMINRYNQGLPTTWQQDERFTSVQRAVNATATVIIEALTSGTYATQVHNDLREVFTAKEEQLFKAYSRAVQDRLAAAW